MGAVKNIIFDLGGVLLDIDYQQTRQAFIKLGVENFDDFYTLTTANEIFESLETGHLDEDAFYGIMQQYCRPGTTQEEIRNAWNALLLHFRKESLDYLRELSSRYKLYLLSNTNKIHHTAFTELYKQQVGSEPFDELFTKAYYSHLVSRRKPYADIYRFILEDAGIRAEETLFIDDAKTNVEAASQLGIQTHLLQKGETIVEVLREKLGGQIT